MRTLFFSQAFMYIEGELSIVRKGDFEDSEGKEVKYFTNWIKMMSSEGQVEVLQLNSSEDFSAAEGKMGTFAIRLFSPGTVFDRSGKPVKGLYKLSLVGFKQAEG